MTTALYSTLKQPRYQAYAYGDFGTEDEQPDEDLTVARAAPLHGHGFGPASRAV